MTENFRKSIPILVGLWLVMGWLAGNWRN